MELENDVLVWKHRGQPQPQHQPEDEKLLDFDFFDLPQLPQLPIAFSLENRVIKLEETML